jgi:hypothetical protein
VSGSNGHGSVPEALNARPWKIPPVPVPADDCVIHVGRQYGELTDDAGTPILDENGKPKKGVVVDGTPYTPHKGETIWLLPVQNMSTYLAYVDMNQTYAESRDDPDRDVRQKKSLHALAAKLSNHVAAWDWTDNGGDPLPQPYHNPDVLIDLDNEELMWIFYAVQSGPPADRKNGHAPSPTTSSATGQRPRRPSSAGSATPSTTASPA